MKTCPSCNRTYKDGTLRFCLGDGTPLILEDPEVTLVKADVPTVQNTEWIPTDPAVILSQLTKIEYDWYDAQHSAEIERLDRILADEYVGTGVDGIANLKSDYLEELAPTNSNVSRGFGKLKLSVNGKVAALTGVLIEKTLFRTRKSRFSDKFVWRDGRWQVTSSETTEVN